MWVSRLVRKVSQSDAQRVSQFVLARPYSRFLDIEGVQVHYRLERVEERRQDAIVCFHGFGAWLDSFRPCWDPLRRELGRPILAFDRPGFGLTQRPAFSELFQYMPEFGAFMGMSLADRLELVGRNGMDPRGVVLLGHSLGALVAAKAAIRYNDKVSALILVAPLLSGPQRTSQGRKLLRKALRVAVGAVLGVLILLSRSVVSFGVRFVFRVARAILVLLIEQDTFWKSGLITAWNGHSSPSEEILEGYMLPRRVIDWDIGILRLCFATAADTFGLSLSPGHGRIQLHPSSEDPSSSVVNELASRPNIPILIIQGQQDVIVPPSQAKTLAKTISHAELCLLDQCGHLPHEEMPEEFSLILRDFLARVGQDIKQISEREISRASAERNS